MDPSPLHPWGIGTPVCKLLFVLKEPCASRCSASAQALGVPLGWVQCEKSQQKRHLLMSKVSLQHPRVTAKGLSVRTPKCS